MAEQTTICLEDKVNLPLVPNQLFESLTISKSKSLGNYNLHLQTLKTLFAMSVTVSPKTAQMFHTLLILTTITLQQPEIATEQKYSSIFTKNHSHWTVQTLHVSFCMIQRK